MREKKITIISLLSVLTCVSTLFISSWATNSWGKVSSYTKINYNGTLSAKFTVTSSDNKTSNVNAYCCEYSKGTPAKNTIINSVSKSTNQKLRKALYYGYKGPKQLDMFKTQDTDLSIVQTAAAVSLANGDSGINSKYHTFYNKLSNLDNPPNWFSVYIANTSGSSIQNLAFCVKDSSITIEKKSAKESITIGNSNFSLKGAKYGVYSNSSCTKKVTTLTTTAENNDHIAKSNTEILTPGTYYIKETTAPTGYKKDTIVYTVKLEEGKAITKKVSDAPKQGKLKIVKTSSDTALTNNNSSYSLSGAEYTIYSDKNCTKKVNTVTTATNGQTSELSLDVGTYYIKETKAPKGYKLNSEVKSIKIEIDKTTTANVKDDPYDEGQLCLQKSSSNPALTNGNDNYSLKDAVYGVYSDAACTKEVSTLTTDANGKSQTITLKVGKYYIKEKTAPKGFEVDTKVKNVTIVINENKTISVTDNPMHFLNTLSLKKVDATTFQSKPQGEATLKNAEFSISYSETRDHEPNKQWLFKTDNDGIIELDNGYLISGDELFDTGFPDGFLTVKEIKAPEGYNLNEETFVFEIKDGEIDGDIIIPDKVISSEVTIVKVDKTTNKPVKLAGTTFRILDKDKNILEFNDTELFTTDETGKVTLPEELVYGSYYLEEVTAANGYTKGELHPFEIRKEGPMTVNYANDNVMGSISVTKIDEETRELLDGAEFNIIANGDIITPDGTVRAEDGEIVDTITTVDGEATSKDLFLGSYIIKESKQPLGYVLSNETKEVTLEYADQYTAKVSTEVEFENTANMLIIKKIDSDTSNSIMSVIFKITKENSEFEAECITDEDGEIYLDHLETGIYHIQETKAAPGYAVKNDIIDFTVDEFGKINDKSTETITVENTPIKILGTVALDSLTKLHQAFMNKSGQVIDTVKMTGLEVGKEYKLEAVPMNKETGEVIAESVTKTFIATNYEQGEKVEINIDTTDLKNKDIVIFEELYDEDVLVAEHRDLEDEDQTVHIQDIVIGTSAIDKNSGNNIAITSKDSIFIDTVSYEGLISGIEYTIHGKLMDKDTNKPLKIKGKEIIATVDFVPEEENGTIDIAFNLDTSSLSKKDIVVFEKLYYNDLEIASHEDINDEAQTITVKENKTTQTGDSNPTWLFFLIVIASTLGIIVSIKKRK